MRLLICIAVFVVLFFAVFLLLGPISTWLSQPDEEEEGQEPAPSLRDKSSNLSAMLRAGGNFAFIAQNVAAIYHATYIPNFGKSLSEPQRLLTTALLDTQTYLAEGTISVTELLSAVRRVCQEPASASPGQRSVKRLVDLTTQLELMIFQVDTKLDPRDIRTQVTRHLPQISEMIRRTLSDVENCPIYPNVVSNTCIILSDRGFQEYFRQLPPL